MTKELLKEQYALPECRVYEVTLKHSLLTGSEANGSGEDLGGWGGGY